MKTAIITIRAESKSETHEIIRFSMLEPSTTHIRFETTGGQIRESHGCVLSYQGDIDSLPPCPVEFDIILQDECNTPNTPWWVFRVTNTGYGVPERFSSEKSAKQFAESHGVIREIRRNAQTATINQSK